MTFSVTTIQANAPALIVSSGDRATYRFLEFFTAHIRNPNTRRAYGRAVGDFCRWAEGHSLTSIENVSSVHVAAWVEQLGREVSPPTVKQHLAAVRMLFDWLATGGVLAFNPATAVRGPKHSTKKGKTPALMPDEARLLLDAIDTTSPDGLRDRALIGLMVYSFARIGAAVGMRVEDVYTQNRRLWVRLNEKGGKHHEMPCHHNLETWLSAYIEEACLGATPKAPLFQTIDRSARVLSGTALGQRDAHAMIRRRAKVAGIETPIGNHTFRATGITAYLKNGGTLEKAATMANHSSTRTTQLYDRRSDELTLDEIERVAI